jgi:2'-5' RNA ligase
VRVFVAVGVSDAIRHDATRLRERVRRDLHAAQRALRWVDPQHMHLTLRFLGEIEEAAIMRLAPMLAAGFDEASFAYALAGPTWFPGSARPRVLVREVRDGREILERLAREVDRRLLQAGVEAEKDDRAFRPHVTLARVRQGEDRTVRGVPPDWWSGAIAWHDEAIAVEGVTLFQSQLTPRGAVHTPLARAPLRAGR